MIRNLNNRRNQPSLLDHLLASGFLLWLFCIGFGIVLSLILGSELGDLLRNKFLPLLLLATGLFLANIFLAGSKYSNWLADCDRTQKEVLSTLKCYEVLRFVLAISIPLMAIATVWEKLKDY